MVLRGAAWYCVVLRGAAWCCMVLRDAVVLPKLCVTVRGLLRREGIKGKGKHTLWLYHLFLLLLLRVVAL